MSGLLLITGLILTTNFTVAKNLETQKLMYSLQSTSSQALNSAQSWARDTMALQSSEGLNSISLSPGSGSSQNGCVDTSCTWQFINSWRVTGGTFGGVLGEPSNATNLQPGVNEGRLSMIVTTTVYKNLSDPLKALATRSQLVTARSLDVEPFIAITAVEEANANAISADTIEGDTAGVLQSNSSLGLDQPPSVSRPSNYVNTVIASRIDCINSNQAQNKDPYLDVPTGANVPQIPKHDYVPTDEDLVWIYEAPCNIAYLPVGAPSNFKQVTNGEYESSKISNQTWLNGNLSEAGIK